MNRRGFTLIELLTALLILGIITGILVAGIVFDFNKTKAKTEEVFIGTIRDAMDIYLGSSDAKKLNYNTLVCTLNKTHGNVNLYKANDITMKNVINSEFQPILQQDLVNPANEKVSCDLAKNIKISVYRDDDYVYYYKIDRNELRCLTTTGNITNLPSECEV